MNYLQELNEPQRQAVECLNGPIMVIAGAGSGKTRVLTYKIAHLINNGISPFNILALTFTNKAAREMKERIYKILNNGSAKNLWMGTFHSVFARILREESELLGYPKTFTIYDTDDSKSLIKDIIKLKNLDDTKYKPAMVQKRISMLKSNLISADAYLNNIELKSKDKVLNMPELGDIYKAYVDKCKANAAMDFDDLLINIFVLFNNNKSVLEKYQNIFKYILVDEFQDTNFVQFSIINQLASKHKNICVVGDDAQSIYAFRGANIQNILTFKSKFAELQTFKLEQNYRSTQNIVEAANSIIKKNKNQLEKEIWTDNEKGEKIKIISALSDNEESSIVANSIFEVKMNNQCLNNDFAILYRTNAQSRSIEEALRRKNINYRIFGGLSFYKRKEIQDILAYFRLAINKKDEEALKRIINYPARGIGKTTFEKCIITAEANKVSLYEVIEATQKFNLSINSGTTKLLEEFSIMINSFSAELNSKNAYELGSRIASETGILKDLYVDKSPEGVSRYENIQELLNALKDFVDNDENEISEITSAKEEKGLGTFMESVALLTDKDEKDKNNEDYVSLMTIHQAKGLEFPYVYVTGLEENLFPSQLSVNSRVELEEERRLFYVALTRAQKKATLTFAKTRYKWGSLSYTEPSRFIDEIDSMYVDFPDENNINSFEKLNYGSKMIFKSNYESKKPEAKEVKPIPIINNTPKNLKKITPSITSSSQFKTDIQVGMKVNHEKFGEGKVIHIEGESGNLKATVFFQSQGQKTLLLKFAKLEIID